MLHRKRGAIRKENHVRCRKEEMKAMCFSISSRLWLGALLKHSCEQSLAGFFISRLCASCCLLKRLNTDLNHQRGRKMARDKKKKAQHKGDSIKHGITCNWWRRPQGSEDYVRLHPIG